ncbi:MAG: lipopolysaccharide heptosyltransferase II [Armatimonadaceae bacterium]
MFRRALPEPVRTVVVLTKHRFMGDTIVAVPLLRATRQVFPEARITLATGAAAAVALQNCPFLDRMVCYNPRERRFDARRFYEELTQQNCRPDVCLVADRSFRSAYVALRIGGKVRAGFVSEGRGFLLTHPVPYRTDTSEIECCLDILRAVVPEGRDTPGYDPTPELFLTEAERERGAQILREEGAASMPLVGIQPGASYTAKQWLASGYGTVARELARDRFGIVLLGSGVAEEEAAAQMIAAMRGTSVINLTGKTSLRETMGVLAHLQLFIGNDTGVNHIAASLSVPTIGLFGPTSARKWGHTGPKNIVLTAPDGNLCRLETAAVLEAARNLLCRERPWEASLGAAR